MTLHGHVSNGVVVLPNSSLPDGTLVEVIPLKDKSSLASGPAILAALEKLPKVPSECVVELDQAIAAGRRPPSSPAAFPDETSDEE